MAQVSPWAAGEVARGEFLGQRGARHGGQAEAVREAQILCSTRGAAKRSRRSIPAAARLTGIKTEAAARCLGKEE